MWFMYYRCLLLVFLSLAPKSTYAKNCLLFLHHLNHWKEQRLPVMELLKHSIYSFNEEMGEQLFATLGHTVVNDNHQCRLSQLHEAFQAQPYLQAVVASSHEQAQLEESHNSHSSNASFPAELAKLTHYLQTAFLKFQDDSWRPLAGKVAKGKSFAKAGSQYGGPIPLPASLFPHLQPKLSLTLPQQQVPLCSACWKMWRSNFKWTSALSTLFQN